MAAWAQLGALLVLVGGTVLLAEPANRIAAVSGGVLRWQDDGSEVALFGVNYYAPFSIDFKLLHDRGLDAEAAIRQDLAHLERLGLSAIRLHCFDREISDRQGNLVDNRHLQVLDLLISEAARRGIYTVLTPIAWWQVPEPGGFSDLYTMPEMTGGGAARAAQCRYLGQFMSHVNRYTNLACKDDPAVVAIELINEPIYPQGVTEAQITEYIDALAKAVRDSGSRKPVFYNCWGGHEPAAAASSLDGVTFGWYPTGLVNGAMVQEDCLRLVNDYPGMRDPRLAAKAKIVYEFDAADVHGSVMYPAMARAFRSGGAQIATQFQYDLLDLAGGNPNWQTHYLNLVYTPGKAISFAIAAEVMRRVPRLESFGPYPGNATFGGFRLSHEKDLSEWVSAEAFLYSNDTQTRPPSPADLRRVAGCGSSPVVDYPGTGAYFLDRLAPGLWKLQVYPDVVMIADPYTGGDHEKVRVLWARWPMCVSLPDLGSDFRVSACRGGRPGGTVETTRDGRFAVGPGEYVLVAGGGATPDSLPGVEFVAPPAAAAPPAAYLDIPRQWREGQELTVRATVAMPGEVACGLNVRAPGATAYQCLPLSRYRAYGYQVRVPTQLVRAGILECYLTVRDGTQVVNFPGGDPGERAPAVVGAGAPVELLRIAAGDPAPTATYHGAAGKSARAAVVAGPEPGTSALRLEADAFDQPGSCAAMEWKVRDLEAADVGGANRVTFLARGEPQTGAVEISLVQDDGNAFGTDIALSPDWCETTVPLAQLRAMWQTKARKLDLSRLDHLTFVFGAWNLGQAADSRHGVEMRSVQLRRQPDVCQVSVIGKDAPFWLAGPVWPTLTLHGHPGQVRVVPGMDPGQTAVRVAVKGFEPQPDCTSFRLTVAPGTDAWRSEMRAASALVVKARAAMPQTQAVELVLTETDSAPWGAVVKLTPEWREIRLPLTELRFFSHWQHGSQGRGGAGDGLRPDQVQSLNLCFGAWLYGEERSRPHAFDVQAVGLAR